MCLDTIDKKVTTTSGTGFKVFSYKNHHLIGVYQHKTIPTNRWLKAEHHTIHLDNHFNNDKTYESGFHILLKKPPSCIVNSLDYGNLREVYFRKVTTQGTDKTITSKRRATVVADEMWVPSLINPKYPEKEG